MEHLGYTSGFLSVHKTKRHARAFFPTSIPDLQLWLDASDTNTITESGGFVSQWDDKSGNDIHAIQLTGTNQPVTGGDINGVNAITFDGSDDALVVAANPFLAGMFSTGGTFIFVTRAVTGSDFPRVCEWAGEANIRLGSGGAQIIFDHLFTGDSRTSRSDYGITTPKIMTVTYDGSDVENDVVSYRNGVLLSQDVTVVPSGEVAVGTGELFVGNDSSLNRAWDGEFGEVLMYNRIVSDAERNSLHNYLSAKWGIALI